MPALIPYEAASLLGSVVIILVGILVEKHWVSGTAATTNAISAIIALTSLQNVGWPIIAVFLAYTFVVFFLAIRDEQDFLKYTGSKATGAFLFVLGIAELRIIDPTNYLHIFIAAVVSYSIVFGIGMLVKNSKE